MCQLILQKHLNYCLIKIIMLHTRHYRYYKKESEETDCVYSYMDRLSDMLDSDNSYIRTRGLTLLAYNAKWDKDYKIDEIIDKYLKHITDVKPITARQCIMLLPIVAKHKPELKK